MTRLSNFIRNGTIKASAYGWIGSALLLLKQFVDRKIASAWHEPWSIWSYWMPLGRLMQLNAVPVREQDFLLALTAAAIPFVFIGVLLTVARLRTVGLPLWLAVLFFVPVVNVLFFLLLLTDPRSTVPRSRTWLPDGALGNAIAAVSIATVIAALVTVLNTRVIGTYGTGLFIALPFCLGLLATMLYAWHWPRSFGRCMGVSALAVCVPGFAMLLIQVEGAACLIMAIPLAIPLGLLGGCVGWAIQARPTREIRVSTLLLPLLFSPAFTGMESLLRPPSALIEVSSSVDIAAPPQAVWNQVVAFSEIPEPTEWLFRAGVAYPIRARIQGRGPGAIRRCEFSTGPFIEPIQIWDEPRLLRFGVTHNPAPMNEMSPYGLIDTPHLHGYMESRQGQFLLTPLPNGHTRLAGTTWYTHGLWPAAYWTVWSDYIIHRIHMRVLQHIKFAVEG